MALTDVAIVNMANRDIDVDPITALSDDTERANVANEFYSQVLKEELSAHRWAFAEKHAFDDTADGTPSPDVGFDHYYNLPADNLVLEEVLGSVKYRVVQDAIHTSEDEIYIVYTHSITDVTKFPSLFVKVLRFALAMAFAPSLAASDKLPTLSALYEDAVGNAVMAGEAQIRKEDQIVPDGDWTKR